MTTAPSISQISITNAQTVGYNRSFEMFGGDITFKLVDTITVSVLVSDISNNGGILSDISDWFSLQSSDEWSYLSINGVSYDKAKLLGFSLPEGRMVKIAKANLTFSVLKEGNLESLGGYYSDFSSLVNDDYIDSISDSLSYSLGDNSCSYKKDISIKFSDRVDLTDSQSAPLVTKAQNFANNILSSQSGMPTVGIEDDIDQLVNNSYSSIRSETFDVINNQCSFSDTISALNVKTSQYSHSCTNDISINEKGIASVSENGVIKGLVSGGEDAGYTIEIENARSRMQNIFNEYSGCGSLNTDGSQIKFISSTKTEKDEERIIEYSVVADNDPKKDTSSGDNVISNQVIEDYVQNGYSGRRVSGTITGLSKQKVKGGFSSIDNFPKYKEAYDYFKSHISSWITSNQVGSPKVISRSESHAFYNGAVSYSFEFSSDPKYSDNDSVKQYVRNFSDTKAVTRKNQFGIIKDKTLVQVGDGNTKGTRSESANIIGYRITPNEGAIKASMDTVIPLVTAYLEETTDFPISRTYTASLLNDVTASVSASYTNDMESP